MNNNFRGSKIVLQLRNNFQQDYLLFLNIKFSPGSPIEDHGGIIRNAAIRDRTKSLVQIALSSPLLVVLHRKLFLKAFFNKLFSKNANQNHGKYEF